MAKATKSVSGWAAGSGSGNGVRHHAACSYDERSSDVFPGGRALLAGELSPDTVRAVVLVDIVPDMNQSGATRIHSFMNDRMTSGFGSLEEVADAIQEYNPNRGRPTDLDGLRTNLRLRDGRWYWHWDPKFIDGTSALPPIEVTEVDRMHAAVEAIIRNNVPMLLVRGQMSDLVTKEKADEFIARFPAIDFVDVGGAGHMVAGDRNDLFAASCGL